MVNQPLDSKPVFDLGHQGDVDYTQIVQMLALTPTERLDRHEGWRLFVKEALARAAIREVRPRGPGQTSRGASRANAGPGVNLTSKCPPRRGIVSAAETRA